MGSLEQSLGSAKTNLAGVGAVLDEIAGQNSLVDRLIAKGEKRRRGRIDRVAVRNMHRKGNSIHATTGTGDYRTHVTFSPPGHFCTCIDWQTYGKQTGTPCKHVMALGEKWRTEVLDTAAMMIDDALVGVLERVEV
jgi:hypothetical protein